jgi:malonyl-CoA/methylmalonyl-CoA synthetase
VLLTQSNLTAQSLSLLKAWRYRASDRLLHVLPLHHIHGVVNALLTPIHAGCSVEFLFPFNVTSVWHRFALPFLPDQPSSPIPLQEPISFFTAVPTIYSRLLESYSTLPTELRDGVQKAIAPVNLRLNVCGSAALPTPTKQAWTTLTNGNILLERYGMTEVGMALSCGLDPEDRVDGSVGWPLPSVEARLFDSERGCVVPVGAEMDAAGREYMGEIQLRGPTVFKEYWRNTDATDQSFVDGDDGHGKWFCTGDMAVRRKVPHAGGRQPWSSGDMYFILGRKSADIIKTGGEKVSALEVEREMLSL